VLAVRDTIHERMIVTQGRAQPRRNVAAFIIFPSNI